MQPSLRISTVSFSILSCSQEFYAKLGFNVDYQITVTVPVPPMNSLVKFPHGSAMPAPMDAQVKDQIFLVHMTGRALKCSTYLLRVVSICFSQDVFA